MCKCTPEIRTPFCGKGNCKPPEKEELTVDVSWEDPEGDLIAAVRQTQEVLQYLLDKDANV